MKFADDFDYISEYACGYTLLVDGGDVWKFEVNPKYVAHMKRVKHGCYTPPMLSVNKKTHEIVYFNHEMAEALDLAIRRGFIVDDIIVKEREGEQPCQED